MKSAILSVGTELLFGQIINTNTVFLSQQLNLLGHDVMYHYTVGDNPARLADMLKLALEDCDIVITTGGLGPTQDDLTKETVCQVMDDDMVLNENILEKISDYFKDRGRLMTENNRKQAILPSRSVVFNNDAGTAPGFALEKDGKYVISMPGPPKEMTRMFEKSVMPFLQNLSEGVIYHRMIRTFGIGESRLETELLDLIDEQTDPTIATYAKEGEASLRIASKRNTYEAAKSAVDDMLLQVEKRIGDFIYSCDDEELVQVVARKLIENKLTISCAESCTGGSFAAALTDVAGISSCFDRGIVTYSNNAKVTELGVNISTLEKFGAVSKETALEMADGLNRVSGSDICISVTGIAGPSGGSEEKPVGLIYIGLKYKEKLIYRELNTGSSNRKSNRNYSVLNMLDMINKECF